MSGSIRTRLVARVRGSIGGGLLVAAAITVAGGVSAAELVPVSQLREASALTRTITTGYQCIDPFPAPGCPVPLGDVSTLDSDTAPPPILSTFQTTASVAGGEATATHDSTVSVGGIVATGSASSQGAMSEGSDPCCLMVLIQTTRSTRDDADVTFTVDAPTPFTFDASGHILYPDPSFPVPWDVSLEITLTGPGGEVASLTAVPDYGCISDPVTFECTVAPTPVSISGVLAPGTYTLDVTLETMGSGTWLHSAGSVAGFSSGAYDVALVLGAGVPVPLPGLPGAIVLGALLAGSGVVRACRARPAR